MAVTVSQCRDAPSSGTVISFPAVKSVTGASGEPFEIPHLLQVFKELALKPPFPSLRVTRYWYLIQRSWERVTDLPVPSVLHALADAGRREVLAVQGIPLLRAVRELANMGEFEFVVPPRMWQHIAIMKQSTSEPRCLEVASSWPSLEEVEADPAIDHHLQEYEGRVVRHKRLRIMRKWKQSPLWDMDLQRLSSTSATDMCSQV